MKDGDKVIVTHRGVEVEGEIMGRRQWVQIGGQSATKHCPVSSAVWGWGYKVRSPIVMSDGSLYRVRGQIAMGIGYVSEDFVRAK